MPGKPDGTCQMQGCDRQAERTLSFKRHQNVQVCSQHYQRNRLLRYGVWVGVSLVLAVLFFGVYTAVF